MAFKIKDNYMTKIYRHGDVLLASVQRTPEIDAAIANAKGKAEVTIALGEATGHHHTLYPVATDSTATLVEINGKRFIDVGAEYFLRHQEHHELRIEPGLYEITMEEEYCPFSEQMKKVVD